MQERMAAEGPLSEAAFKAALVDLLRDHPAKVWLARSTGQRLDTLFSVGGAQGEPIRNFDHLNGFYLMGEGVTPDLLSPIHALFVRFCASHRTDATVHPHGRVIDLHYQHHAGTPARPVLTLHMPFSVGT